MPHVATDLTMLRMKEVTSTLPARSVEDTLITTSPCTTLGTERLPLPGGKVHVSGVALGVDSLADGGLFTEFESALAIVTVYD